MSKPIAYWVTARKPYTLVYTNSANMKSRQHFAKGRHCMAAETVDRCMGEKLDGAMSKLEELMLDGQIGMEEIAAADEVKKERETTTMIKAPHPKKKKKDEEA